MNTENPAVVRSGTSEQTAPVAQSEVKETKRYANYDKTYKRFLPGVFETKDAAGKAGKTLKDTAGYDVGNVETREV